MVRRMWWAKKRIKQHDNAANKNDCLRLNLKQSTEWQWLTAWALLHGSIPAPPPNKLHFHSHSEKFDVKSVWFWYVLLLFGKLQKPEIVYLNSYKWPTWGRILFSYMFISNLYMLQALMCSSSGEWIVSIRHLVYVTLCRWRSGIQVGVPPKVYQYDIWYMSLYVGDRLVCRFGFHPNCINTTSGICHSM
jgi:hypothetical protein